MKVSKCPECGSTYIRQEEVDVGIGTIYGPASCYDCRWTQEGAESED